MSPLHFASVTIAGVLLLTMLHIESVENCHHFVNRTKLVPVTRTRYVTRKGSDVFRRLNPFKKSTVEEYTDFEIQTELVTECCRDYKLTNDNRCIPSCPLGCQEYATCVLPGKCQCNDGYILSKSTTATGDMDVCLPDCQAAGCPTNGRCIAPNECTCDAGYKREGFYCVPKCSSGCPNGICIAPEICHCDAAYQLNPLTSVCEDQGITLSNGEEEQQQKEVEEKEENSDSKWISEDPSEIASTTIISPSPSTSTSGGSDEEHEDYESSSTSCPDEFIRYKNDCRPVIASDAECEDSCGLNAVCTPNGTCICKPGFGLVETSSLSASDNSGAACHLLVVQQIADKFDPNWLAILLTATAVAFVLGAVIFLAVRLLTRQKGHFDVKDKEQEYSIAYEHNQHEEQYVM